MNRWGVQRRPGLSFPRSCGSPRRRTDGNNVEFLEILQFHSVVQDISSYQIVCADMNYTFPSNTIIPGGASSSSPPRHKASRTLWPDDNVFGPYSGSPAFRDAAVD